MLDDHEKYFDPGSGQLMESTQEKTLQALQHEINKYSLDFIRYLNNLRALSSNL